jgi:hypothetical protein
MVKKLKEQSTLQVGDKVMWKGIPLTVHRIKEDGSVEAASLTMHVTVSHPEEFEKVDG